MSGKRIKLNAWGRWPTRVSLALMLFASAPAAIAQEVVAEAATEDPEFFFFTDTSVSLSPYGMGYEVDPDEQSAVTIEHAHASKIGDFFMFVDYNQFHGTPDGADDTTWYSEISPRLSLGKMSGKDLSHTFFKRSLFEIKDVLIAAQYERGEDPDIAEAVLLGVGFDLDVREAGLLGRLGKFNYVQLNIYGRNDLVPGAANGFHDMQMSMVASYPIEVGKQKFLVDGYFDWVLGIGSDEDWSYHLNPQITWDAGAAGGHPGKFYVGIEVDLWWNKYQIPNTPGFDTNQQAVSLLLKYHF
jgi:nucleoside-specific outer membrane channel protein Tsx